MYNEFPTIIGILALVPFYAVVFTLICMYLCIRFEWIGELFSNIIKLIFRKKEPLLLPPPPAEKVDWEEIDTRLAIEKEKGTALNNFIEFIEAHSWKWQDRNNNIIKIYKNNSTLTGTVYFEQYNPNAPGLKVTQFVNINGEVIKGMEKKETPFFMLKSYYDNIVKQNLTKLETIAQNFLLKGESYTISPEDFDEGKVLNDRELEAFKKALEDIDIIATITENKKIILAMELDTAVDKSELKKDNNPTEAEIDPQNLESFAPTDFDIIDNYFGYEDDEMVYCETVYETI